MKKTMRIITALAAACAVLALFSVFVACSGSSVGGGDSSYDDSDSPSHPDTPDNPTNPDTPDNPEQDICTITFYPNAPADVEGGESIAPEKLQFPKNSEQWLAADVFRFAGYLFVGWSDSKENADTKAVLYDNPFSVSEDCELYAAWEEDPNFVFDAIEQNGLIIRGSVVVGYTEELPADVVIPDGITGIANYAFEYCETVKSVYIPDSVESIGYGAFSVCENLETVVLPNGITEIKSDTFSNCWNLSTITIPQGVESIGVMAFFACKKLAHIEIPPSVTSIGDGAFGMSGLESFTIPATVKTSWQGVFGTTATPCEQMKSIVFEDGVTCIEDGFSWPFPGDMEYTIPASVTSIVGRAFDKIGKIVKITIDVNAVAALSLTRDDTGLVINGDQWLYENSTIDTLVITGNGSLNTTLAGINAKAIEIGDGVTGSLPVAMFASCTDLETIKIGSGITEIGKRAFSGASLPEIDIPETVTAIGDEAFECCRSLKRVSLSKIEHIGNDVFYDCESLTEINVPETVTYIGQGAFYRCNGLKKISLPKIEHIGNDAFAACENLTEVDISGIETVTIIGDEAFASCTGLERVSLCTVGGIGASVFANCTNLSEVILPENLKEIPYRMFGGCKQLKSIDIPDSVTEIKESAFSGSGLQTVSIPDSVAIINIDCFSRCTDLESCVIGAGLKTAGDSVFVNTPKVTITFTCAQVPKFEYRYVSLIRKQFSLFGEISEVNPTNTLQVPAGTSDGYKEQLLRYYPNLNIIEVQ